MQYQSYNRRTTREKTQQKNRLLSAILIIGIALALFGAGYITAKLQAREARMAAYAEANSCTWQWDMTGRILPADEAYICK
jgi:hypothetical protein